LNGANVSNCTMKFMSYMRRIPAGRSMITGSISLVRPMNAALKIRPEPSAQRIRQAKLGRVYYLYGCCGLPVHYTNATVRGRIDLVKQASL
jgi:hypothetical protein